jgi:hypothetical protein
VHKGYEESAFISVASKKKHHGRKKKMIEHQETGTHRGRGGASGDEQEEGRRLGSW